MNVTELLKKSVEEGTMTESVNDYTGRFDVNDGDGVKRGSWS